jgi:hypothetical protein
MFSARTLSGGLGVGRDGFIQLMKDCRLAAAATHKGGVSVKALEHLFVRCVGLYEQLDEQESRIEQVSEVLDEPSAFASRVSIKENKERNKKAGVAVPTIAARDDAEVKKLRKLAYGGNVALTIEWAAFCTGIRVLMILAV